MGAAVLNDPQVLLLLGAVFLWTFPWKAWALWLAARRGDRWWFLMLLALNTLAILEIVYIFFVAKMGKRVGEEA